MNMKGKSFLLAGVMAVGLFFFSTVSVVAEEVASGTYVVPSINQIMGDWTVTLSGRSTNNVGTKTIIQDKIVLVLESYKTSFYSSNNCYDVSGVVFDAADKDRESKLGNCSLGFCTNANFVWGWYSFFVDGCWEIYNLSLFYLEGNKLDGIFNRDVWSGQIYTEFSVGTATLRN
jgi:hypothetical protein